MSPQSASTGERTAADLSLIDCDVHQMWGHPDEVVQYLPDHWQARGIDVPTNPWPSPVGLMRDDASPESGIAGSDPALMREQHIDPYDIEYAILNATGMLTLGVTPNEHYAAALAKAQNDWLREHWLEQAECFKGGLVVAPQAPQRAAEEIERLGDHPDIVQVQMSSVSRTPYGRREYWPIYEAAAAHDLPVALHIGPEGMGTSSPHTAAGYPSSYFERHVLTSASLMGQLTSLLLNGVFEKFGLDLVLIEGGFSWLPYLRWRLDKDWRGLREQTPWLDRPPSAYITDHVYLTTQPLPEPTDPAHLRQMFDMIDAHETVMFASDYPHWDADDPRAAFPPLEADLERQIFRDTAAELYGL
jgi:predicted TIM-barrel fold metal-dependent hydrolase